MPYALWYVSTGRVLMEVVVTKHKKLVDLLIEEGIVTNSAKVVEHHVEPKRWYQLVFCCG